MSLMHMPLLRRAAPLLPLLLAVALPPSLAGNRMMRVRDSWLLSTFERTAIARPGYDYAPSVMVEEGSYRMWWCGSAPSGNPFVDHIWEATSSDGLNWSGHRAVLGPSPLALICDPSVVRVRGIYHMYFTGTRRLDGSANEVYLATSEDGVTWKKYPDDVQPRPVIALPAGESGYGIGQPSVLYIGGRFLLYYTDTTRDGGGTFLAASSDGVEFAPENGGRMLLATNSVDVKYSVPMELYIMVHGSSHDRLYFAHSSDGIHWQLPATYEYLAHPTSRNKAFEGCLAGSATGTMGRWTFYYYASHQGTPGLIQEPLKWDIEAGRLSFSSLPASGTVFRFNSPLIPSRNHYYETTLSTPPFYEYQVRAFSVRQGVAEGLSPLFRLYHPRLQNHFYTADPAEKDAARNLGYLDEGNLGFVSRSPMAGGAPLYRLYHARGDHFYTLDAAERDRRLQEGYRDEGVAAWAWPPDLAGRPAAPRLTSLALFGAPREVTIDYDASGVPGAFDILLELSAPDTTFQSANPSTLDPSALLAMRLTGNSGILRLSTQSLQNGRYQVRYAALDEKGQPLGSYSDTRTLQVGTPPAPDQPPFGFLDVPSEGFATDGPLVVEGWALDDQEIRSVEVFVDGISQGRAITGRARPDVARVFPSFPGAAAAGYRLETNVSHLPSGVRQIVVELTDSHDQVTVLGPRSFHLLQGGNSAPFGVLDLPAEGALAAGFLEIGGWALDDRGVARVEIRLDGIQHADATLRVARPDVAAVFPGFPDNPVAGFTAGLDLAGQAAGTHLLAVRIIDGQGLTTDLPPRTFVKTSP